MANTLKDELRDCIEENSSEMNLDKAEKKFLLEMICSRVSQFIHNQTT